MTQLIITEKPSVSEKIAEALSDGKPKKVAYDKKVSYYELKHKRKKILVVCAVGHLFTVAEKDKKGWTYPTFSTEWVPSYESQKSASFTRPYLNAIKKLSKDVDDYIVACDWDIEGEVIGYNILRFVCKKSDAGRMHFSTTTKEDLLNAYEKRLKHLDKGFVESGLTRHVLDWLWGINLSRALTLSIKNSTGMFKILSSGRVQGPALKILAEKEKEIQKFKPEPFWKIELVTSKLRAWHKKDKFWKKEEAEAVAYNTKNKKAVVDKVEKKEQDVKPPFPFDLTALQLAAYKKLYISPKETLSVAQELYTNSYISYPRTSSNQLPSTINFKKILKALSKQKNYEKDANKLSQQKTLRPNNGGKKDSAHPAVFPTGVIPKKLSEKARKVYDLIVRRFLATFGETAVKENVKVVLDVNKEAFIAKGSRVLKQGWYELYGKYAAVKEEQLPALKEKQELNVKKIEIHDEETQPPKRYTPASIIKELEKRELGTKATRADIIESLYYRDYVKEKSLEVTELGMKTVETLKKYAPEILDEELTRRFEKYMGEIREGKEKKKDVLYKAETFLTGILGEFRRNEKNIGLALSKAYKETRDKANVVGKCPVCGANLRILYSRKFRSYFVACSAYPECTTTFSLTQGLPKPTEKKCPECGYPLVMIIRKGKRPFDYCINKNCPKKLEWIKQQQEKAEKEGKEFGFKPRKVSGKKVKK
ncbi:MAG: DNA topoisomerase I [Nanoarchaeota archaeon]|nr:DNA topoisomerase I [Nanoarchaeota archaeon]